MRSLKIFLILICAILPACNPANLLQQDLRSSVDKSWQEWVSENGDYTPENLDESPWKFSYHPIIYLAWKYKGSLRTDSDLETRLHELNDGYWTLDRDLSDQVAEGNTSFDRDRFLALIDDTTARDRTSMLIDEGVQAIYAYARAVVEPLRNTHDDLPEQVLRLLGKLYSMNSGLLEVPTSRPVIDDETKWRDWLHAVIAACGEDGVNAILVWDGEIESLQDLAPDQPFWDGRLTHAMTLRSLQLARHEALQPLISKIQPYHEGGEVPYLEKWIYWNLVKTAWEGGGMYPYTDEDTSTITDVLIKDGLLDGPMGEGEEAQIIVNALGMAPSMGWIYALFQIGESQVTPQERRDLCWSSLSQMLENPDTSWLTTSETATWLKDHTLAVLDDRSFINNPELLRLYSGVLRIFQSRTARNLDVQLTGDDLLRIHLDFIALMQTITDTDERAIALDLFRWGLMQPEFITSLSDSTDLFAPLTDIYYDWGETTTFDTSQTTDIEFGILYRYFGRVLGIGIPWDFITGGEG